MKRRRNPIDEVTSAILKIKEGGTQLSLAEMMAIESARTSGAWVGVWSDDGDIEIVVAWPAGKVPQSFAEIFRQFGWWALRTWKSADGFFKRDWRNSAPDFRVKPPSKFSIRRDGNGVYGVDVDLYATNTVSGLKRLAYAYELETGQKIPKSLYNVFIKYVGKKWEVMALMPDEDRYYKFDHSIGMSSDRHFATQNEADEFGRAGLTTRHYLVSGPAQVWSWVPKEHGR